MPVSRMLHLFTAAWLCFCANNPLALAADPADGGQASAASRPTLAPLYERFAMASESVEQQPTDEVPDFQKHVSPLLGRLGCNGRACHGSFQGQGGFQLSLFGYDFSEDFKALLDEDTGRVDRNDITESLILTKPVDADYHDGGQRYAEGGWEYWVLRNWIEAGAPFEPKQIRALDRLEVQPTEIKFKKQGDTQQLKVIAHWEDGSSEDVTCLCRFQTNDSSIADIDETGMVKCDEPGDTHVVVSYDKAVVPILALRPMSDSAGKDYPRIAASTKIDRLVQQKLRKLGILPSEICTDEEFLRRASLDVTGTLPSPEEILAFQSDKSPDKRSLKIEELLERPGYAAQWTTFFCDITGNNEDQLRNFFPNIAKLSNHWYQWIYSRLDENVPYDQIVEGIVTANSRLPEESYADYCEEMSEICRDPSGEKFAERPGLVYFWARRNFQTPEDRAIGFAYSFLGVRIQCAQCHKHPFDQWSKTDFDQFERLFTAVQARQNTLAPDAKKEYAQMVNSLGLDKKLKGNQLRRELVPLLRDGQSVPLPELVVSAPRAQRSKGKSKMPRKAPKAKLLGGDWVELESGDAREELMQWLRAEDNPYFAKAIVNRIWAQYFGVGIVNPPDDLNLANAPSNEPLLDYLANGFRANNFDLKWVHRQILNSDAYQRSWVPNETNKLDKHNFSHSLLRRLPAEATYDAVRLALARENIAEQARNLALPRAITKPGASAQTNARDDQSYALTVFGRSIRESNCDCDRSSDPSLLQKVFLANDQSVQDWLTNPKTSWVGEVAEKFNWPKPGKLSVADEKRAKQIQDALDRFAKQLVAADKRILDAKNSGNEKQLETLKSRRQEMVDRTRTLARKNGVLAEFQRLLAPQSDNAVETSPDTRAMTDEQATWIAEKAYLRTLSRQPTSTETQRVVAFLKSDENPTSAVEGLLWSLINTKEFILNH